MNTDIKKFEEITSFMQKELSQISDEVFNQQNEIASLKNEVAELKKRITNTVNKDVFLFIFRY